MRKLLFLPPLAILAVCLAHAQSPPAVVNGVYVPEYKGNPATQPGEAALTPLQTELIAPLDIHRLEPGSPVLAKLEVPWSGLGCKLPQNSMVKGHVVEIDPRTKQNRVSRVTVLFDTADCNGVHGSPFPATVVALLAGTLGGDPNLAQGPPLADAIGLAVSGGLRKASAASAITDYSPLPIRKLPSKVLPGQVVGLNYIKLGVGSGQDGGSVLSSDNHDLRLPASTHLILMPRRPAPAEIAAARPSVPSLSPSPSPSPSKSATSAPAAAAAPPPPPEPVDETEVCTSACSSVADAGGLPATTHRATAQLPTSTLGYNPRENRQLTSLDYDSTLIYLDARNLLFTFDPHKLRERGGGVHHESFRTVRAVLIDPATPTVKRVVDWRVQGEGQYIWRAGSGMILAHVGRQLRLFGPDLRPIRTASLPGALAWVSASPSGNRFAVGIYRERHTEAEHQQIFELTGDEPDEDVEVQLFDSDLKLLLTSSRSSDSHPPVLSDSGEIRIQPGGRHKWRISEYRWDRSEHIIAIATSACRPQASTTLSGLLFVVGCDATPDVRWYRMLRPDGHPVLKGRSPSEEIEQSVTSSAPTQFAIRVVHAAKPMQLGQPFTRSDLKKEEISIYRTSDGRRIFATAAAEFPLAEQSFALSPAGNQVAITGDRSINFYAVTPSAAP